MAKNKIPLGLTLPIRDGNNGYFEQAYDSFTQKRMNVINLLRTKIGERRMQPQFGSRLWTILFDQNTKIIPDIITNIVTEDINRWIEGIVIKNVEVHIPKSSESIDDRDIYTVLITVTFEDVASKQEDTVEIVLNSGKV